MINVFVIDDSLSVRKGFRTILEKTPGINLIGEANNPIDAFDEFKKVGLPDVFILDIEMPKMDGISFLKKIMQQKPIPVIICSTLANTGSNATIDALLYGAIDIVEKPRANLDDFFEDYCNDFIDKIKEDFPKLEKIVVSYIQRYQNMYQKFLKE